MRLFFASACLLGSAGLLYGCGDSPSGPSMKGCSTVLPFLAVGEVAAVSTTGSEETICIRDGGGASYLAAPFVAADPNALTAVELLVRVDEGLVPVSRETLGAPIRPALIRGRDPETGSGKPKRKGSPGTEERQEGVASSFHWKLREREREQLGPLLPFGGSVPDPLRSSPSMEGAGVPAVGELLQMSAAASCDVQDTRQGRVVAVTREALVVEDVANPLGGFTASELAKLGARFDDLIHPTVVGAFGAPTDLDQNERVVLFFTRRVNELIPPGGAGIVSGFFWSGDLFPRAQCASSNVGEVLYLAVPDPSGSAGTPVDGAKLRRAVAVTIGHELQHLINSGVRIYQERAPEFEETWLNEGLSFLAEELLFHQESGLQPRANLDLESIMDGGAVQAAFEEFGVHNIGRFNLYVQVPRFRSPTGSDGLETRGASWAFLRYVLDRDPSSDSATLRELVHTREAGLANLASVLGEDPRVWMRDWFLSVYADDQADGGNPRLQQPSWDLRSIIPALRQDARYPLELFGMGEGGYSISLGPGNGSFFLLDSREGFLKILLAPAGALEGGGTLWLNVLRVD